MARAFILLLDSLGIGELPDAADFGDSGANTFLHIKEHCSLGLANKPGVRQGPLQIPNLDRLGLTAAASLKTDFKSQGLYGSAKEISLGKDTLSGHWEIAGVPVLFEWGYFPATYPSFPEELVDVFVKEAKLPGILGNCHASGTEIINRLGDEHIKTEKPICYTSADSVFQIAVHEELFGLERLYELCQIAFKLVQPYKICRVIARPFLGSNGKYHRTDHRRDFSVFPPDLTLLDKLVAAGGNVIAVGKVADIFAHRGISKHMSAYGHDEIFQVLFKNLKEAPDRSLIFANFVDFDMKYGHRRDVVGYADALEKFDLKLPEFEKLMQPDDIAIITADHGCDPTFKGTEHTREYIPILVFGPNIKPRSIGKRDTFADIGQSLAKYFNLKLFACGKSFL
ncbi:MAG: phosphopentomutase [Gammaproteobacteria bacterium]|nr:phosphopentomutase [Gammaproteobacteria bacterium]